MKVYQDFFTYEGGVYRHSDLDLYREHGYHSVRIVGWGEEFSVNGMQKYWVSKVQSKTNINMKICTHRSIIEVYSLSVLRKEIKKIKSLKYRYSGYENWESNSSHYT